MCNWPLAGLLLGLLASVLLSVQYRLGNGLGHVIRFRVLHLDLPERLPRLWHCTSMHPLSPSTHHYRSITDTRAPPRYIHTALVLALLFTIYAFFLSAYVLGPPRLGLPLRIY
jgi:hypothetical protein